MRKGKRAAAILLVLAFMLGLAGCGGSGTDTGTSGSGKENQAEHTQTETQTFTDSLGREVELPKEIEKVAPSGMMAQIMLYTLCPDRLCGLARDISVAEMEFVDQKYQDLPTFGNIYGSNANLNLESLMQAEPDVIIDIGEKKENMEQDLDGLQEQTGIPVIFIEATLPNMAEAYQTLGGLGLEPEQAKKLSAYCEETLSYAKEKAAQIPEKEKKTVYLAMGTSGLNTAAANSIHEDTLEMVGAVNVVEEEALGARAGEVSFEQLLVWQPDYIFADSTSLKEEILGDGLWQDLDAVQNEQIYVIPDRPYSFMNSPPSVNRVVGILWLGKMLYPDLYEVDVDEKIQEFYELFYHVKLSEDQLRNILNEN